MGDLEVISPRDRLRSWLVEHMPALVWVMLALWTPSIVFTVLVDLQLVGGAGSGYPSLRDPSLLLGVMQIALMAAALALMHVDRGDRAWRFLCGSVVIWAAHAAWSIQGRLRLMGRSDLASRETLLTLAALAIATSVLCEVRQRYSSRAVSAPQPTSPRPALLRPGTR